MKKSIFTMSLCFLLVLFLIPIKSQRIYAQTDIPPGNVSGAWTLANSPYNINGEITIPNDSILTIEPGVEVVFTGNYKFNVQGRILAIGTEADTILFTSNDTTGFHNLTIPDGGWGGIKLVDIDSSNDSTVFEYCTFEYGKEIYGNGGAIYSVTDKFRISHCLLRNNLCDGAGGAIYTSGSKSVIEYCEFSRNHASDGDALCISFSGGALIRNNHFHHNSGLSTINIHTSYTKFINNLIEQNHSSDCILSLALICYNSSGNNAEVINKTFVKEIMNNTIVNNTCDQGGAISFFMGSGDLFVNNIIYGNEPSQVHFYNPSSVYFYNCLIEGGKEGFTGSAFTGAYENCMDADPQFVSSNDYRLQNTSPCIGAGIDSIQIGASWFYCPPNCYYGNIRPNPLGSMPDIGACENDLDTPTDIEEFKSQVPSKFALAQNYPNPFNPSTTIKYQLPANVKSEMANVKLFVFDLLGSEVASLVNQNQKPGNYEATWNASRFSSGVYFYKLSAGASTGSATNFVETKKMILIK